MVLWPIFVIAIGVYFAADKSLHLTTFFGKDLRRKTGRSRRADSIDNSQIYGVFDDIELGTTELPTRANSVVLSQPPILYQPRAQYVGGYPIAKDRVKFVGGPHRCAPRASSINVASLSNARTTSIYNLGPRANSTSNAVPYTARSRANSAGSPRANSSGQELWKTICKPAGGASMLMRRSSDGNLRASLGPSGEVPGSTGPRRASRPSSADGPNKGRRSRAYSGGSRSISIHDLSTQIENRPSVPTPLRRCDSAESSRPVDEGDAVAHSGNDSDNGSAKDDGHSSGSVSVKDSDSGGSDKSWVKA